MYVHGEFVEPFERAVVFLPVNLPASIHGIAFDVSTILETWKLGLT
jgi:hypothetical protein